MPKSRQIMGCASQAFEALLTSYGDPLSLTECQHRKIALHFKCFWHGKWGRKPWYFWAKMPEKVWSSWIKLVSCDADVPAQALVRGPDRTEFAHRVCRKCTSGAIANEHHVLLECQATKSVRRTFHARLTWPHPPELS